MEAAAPGADATGVLDERRGVVVERPAQGDEPGGLLVVMLGTEGEERHEPRGAFAGEKPRLAAEDAQRIGEGSALRGVGAD